MDGWRGTVPETAKIYGGGTGYMGRGDTQHLHCAARLPRPRASRAVSGLKSASRTPLRTLAAADAFKQSQAARRAWGQRHCAVRVRVRQDSSKSGRLQVAARRGVWW
jgi:hypothetical protein